VRAEYDAHTRSGRCGHWIGGVGPCELAHGHEGGHEITVADDWDNGGPSPDPDWERERAADEERHTL
jgi:hypothetical protein